MQDIWYKDWFNSDYYHKLYFQRDENEAEAFIARLIELIKPPNHATMLDVACGKGRHSLQLATMGFDVTGIDLSEFSIATALKSESENLHFYQHDMRLPFRINYFDYAFNFFTSFGYFETQRENDNSIRTIAQALKKNGTFVMDYLNVHYAEAHQIPHSAITIQGTQYHIHKWHDENHFYKKIEVQDEALSEPLIFTEKVAKFSVGDFTEMFALQGLQLQELYGDYQLNQFDIKNSPRLIMIARKQDKG